MDVGAGTSSYEPRDRFVVAVEPSHVMVAQRRPGAAPVVRGTAEALPFGDGVFDAAMALLTGDRRHGRLRALEEIDLGDRLVVSGPA